MLKPTTLCSLLALLALMTVAAPCHAADPPAPTTQPAIALTPADQFPRGGWFLADYGGLAVQARPREQIASGAVGIGYFFAKNLSLSLEFTGAGVSQGGRDASIAGADVLLRNHLINGNGWSFFGDVAGGMTEADSRVPSGGTDFNFTLQTGVGFTVKLCDHVDLITGVRYFHLSNARQEGPDRNPSINAAMGYIGLLFPF